MGLCGLVSYHFVSIIITHRLFAPAKTDAENYNIIYTCPRVQTDSGLLYCLWSTGQASGELLTCAWTIQRMWTKLPWNRCVSLLFNIIDYERQQNQFIRVSAWSSKVDAESLDFVYIWNGRYLTALHHT